MTVRPPILALDLATRAGWAELAAGATVPTSGAIDLPDHGPAARVVGLTTWLWPRLAPIAAGRGLLIYEGPIMYPGRANAFRVGCHLESNLLNMARAWGVDHVLVASPAEVKKHATGSGNAKKDEVVRAMRVRWGRTEKGPLGLEDDNEADALALLSYALAALDQGLVVVDRGAEPAEDVA
jgi:hypothetical protein